MSREDEPTLAWEQISGGLGGTVAAGGKSQAAEKASLTLHRSALDDRKNSQFLMSERILRQTRLGLLEEFWKILAFRSRQICQMRAGTASWAASFSSLPILLPIIAEESPRRSSLAGWFRNLFRSERHQTDKEKLQCSKWLRD